MKRNDPKWLARFEGRMAWKGSAGAQHDRKRARVKEQRKRAQFRRSKGL